MQKVRMCGITVRKCTVVLQFNEMEFHVFAAQHTSLPSMFTVAVVFMNSVA